MDPAARNLLATATPNWERSALVATMEKVMAPAFQAQRRFGKVADRFATERQ
jgi:hypothetical protein